MDQAGGVKYTVDRRARGGVVVEIELSPRSRRTTSTRFENGRGDFFAFFLHLRICSTATRERGREREGKEARFKIRGGVASGECRRRRRLGEGLRDKRGEERRGRPTPVEVIDLATTVCVRCLTDVRWAHGEETCEYPPQNGRAQG